MRGGFSRYISPGPLALAINILFWFFSYFLVFSTIFSIFRYVIWKFCCTGNKAFMKVYQWFYWNSNLQFREKSQPIPGALKHSFSALQNFSWRPCDSLLCIALYRSDNQCSLRNINKFIRNISANITRNHTRFVDFPNMDTQSFNCFKSRRLF